MVATMAAHPKCPRCDGKILIEPTKNGDEYVCLACGWVGYDTPIPTIDEIEQEDLYG